MSLTSDELGNGNGIKAREASLDHHQRLQEWCSVPFLQSTVPLLKACINITLSIVYWIHRATYCVIDSLQKKSCNNNVKMWQSIPTSTTYQYLYHVPGNYDTENSKLFIVTTSGCHPQTVIAPTNWIKQVANSSVSPHLAAKGLFLPWNLFCAGTRSCHCKNYSRKSYLFCSTCVSEVSLFFLWRHCSS